MVGMMKRETSLTFGGSVFFHQRSHFLTQYLFWPLGGSRTSRHAIKRVIENPLAGASGPSAAALKLKDD